MISIGLDVVLNLHFAGLHYVPSWENVRLNILDSICTEVFLFVNIVSSFKKNTKLSVNYSNLETGFILSLVGSANCSSPYRDIQYSHIE